MTREGLREGSWVSGQPQRSVLRQARQVQECLQPERREGGQARVGERSEGGGDTPFSWHAVPQSHHCVGVPSDFRALWGLAGHDAFASTLTWACRRPPRDLSRANELGGPLRVNLRLPTWCVDPLEAESVFVDEQSRRRTAAAAGGHSTRARAFCGSWGRRRTRGHISAFMQTWCWVLSAGSTSQARHRHEGHWPHWLSWSGDPGPREVPRREGPEPPDHAQRQGPRSRG